MTKHDDELNADLPLGWHGKVEQAWNGTNLRSMFNVKPNHAFAQQPEDVQRTLYEIVWRVLVWIEQDKEESQPVTGDDTPPRPMKMRDFSLHFAKAWNDHDYPGLEQHFGVASWASLPDNVNLDIEMLAARVFEELRQGGFASIDIPRIQQPPNPESEPLIWVYAEMRHGEVFTHASPQIALGRLGWYAMGPNSNKTIVPQDIVQWSNVEYVAPPLKGEHFG